MDAACEEGGQADQKPAFAELVVQAVGREDAQREGKAAVEIALPGGAVVRVFAGADASLVRSIVEAAKSC